MVYPHIQYQGPAYPDALDDSTAMDPRELDSRVSDGIEVRLRWHLSDGHLSVAVNDTRTGEHFELTVGESDQPLDVFIHPYAYAARRGAGSRPATDVAVGVRAAV